MTTQHAFDRAVTLNPAAADTLSGRTIPEFSNFNGQFGGITAAILLKAVLADHRAQGLPVSITVNYCGAVSQGPFDITLREIRKGRTLQHWSVDMIQSGRATATALVALAQRKPSWGHDPLAAPQVPDPQSVVPEKQWTGWTSQYEFRFVEGSIEGLHGLPPHSEPNSAKSLLWLRQSPPRLLDFPGLVCMSDAFFVRMIQVRNTFPPMGTVSLTTYFHCGLDMLSAQGDDHVLCHVDARVFRDNFHDQSAELWSRDGRLLANSHQIVWYAE